MKKRLLSARPWFWQSLLDSGQVNSVSALAARFHVDHSHVARTLRLASLAPNLVGKIIEGSEPSGLSLQRLMKSSPIRWDEPWAESGGGAVAAVPGIRNESTKQVQTLAAEFQTPVG